MSASATTSDRLTGEWPRFTVWELQQQGILRVEDGNHGESRPRSDEFVEDGTAFIRAADLSGGNVQFSTASKINEQARKRITKGIGAAGDVIISHKGTVGKIARASVDSPPFVCSPQTTFWRSTRYDIIDPDFLYVLMRSKEFLNRFNVTAGETDMAGYVSLTEQRRIEITVPPIAIQNSIANVIRPLDEKIAVNQVLNGTLDGMAKAIFNDWFIDYGPTRAKMEAHEPYLAADAWDLFPDTFDQDGIPSGWLRTSIGELFKVVGGPTPSTQRGEFWDGELAWATPKDLSTLTVPISLATERKITQSGLDQISSGLLPAGTVLLSSRAPIGYVAIAKIPTAINQGFIALVPHGKASSEFGLLWLQGSIDLIKQHANGSTFMEISKSNFKPLDAVVGTPDVMARFDSIVAPLFRSMAHNEQENRKLSEVREYLLPRLLSGEVGLIEADNALKEVM